MDIILYLLSFVALSLAMSPKDCVYNSDGICIPRHRYACPEGTHRYSTGCSRKLPEATCDEANPTEEDFMTCDYTACYCDPPTLRDPVSKKCVTVENCTKNRLAYVRRIEGKWYCRYPKSELRHLDN